MDIDVGATIGDSSAYTERKSSSCEEDNTFQVPYVGMVFDSEYAAREFYGKYARRSGFRMRIDQSGRSSVDMRILSRRFSCNKQGYCQTKKYQVCSGKRLRSSTREGCKAMMRVNVNKAGKWVVTRSVNEHTHPLDVPSLSSLNGMDKKDQRIEELMTMELDHQDKLCELYRGQLTTLLKYIGEQIEHLTGKGDAVADNVKRVESDKLELPTQ
ncbi:unnamed protein product [Cuscuta epithymum]|uniref:FAR1 domain-containing protein n=1 Tax=Cuscuta epithymum TaxID=186058 RepID=A0AAV0EB99_9ASTE|nr:unnamed protein product [Cuscuta epithymum]